jgi:hypothetical protein
MAKLRRRAKARAPAARAQTLTRGEVLQEVISFFRARFPAPGRILNGQLRLEKLGLEGARLAALSIQLNQWPAFATRGLRLTPPQTLSARTVGDVAKLVFLNLQLESAASPKVRRKAKRAKKAIGKPAKPRPGKAASKAPKKGARKAPRPVKKRAPAGVRLESFDSFPAAPAGDSEGGGARRFSFARRSVVRSVSRKKKYGGRGTGGAGRPRRATRAAKKAARRSPPIAAVRKKAIAKRKAKPRRVIARYSAGVPRPSAAPAREPRHANAGLYDSRGDRKLETATSLRSGQIVRLRLDIGELSSDSQIVNPQAIDEMLPAIDLDLDVMVSSTDFALATDLSALETAAFPTAEQGCVVHGYFFLPKDGAAATTRDNKEYLNFYLRVPDAGKGRIAHARIGYYYKNILVQSQQLAAHVGESGGFQFRIDYTLSADLTGLHVLPSKPRISLFTNANGDGGHQIILRHPGQPPSDQDKGGTIRIGEGVDETIEKLRKTLSGLAPKQKQRRQYELIEDLRQLAPIGWDLYTQLPGKLPASTFQELQDNPQDFVVQVARPISSSFVLPWAFLYDIPLISGNEPKICPTIDKWNGAADLFNGSPRQCPSGPHESDVLCPFGFWGTRYAVEQISKTEQPTLEIPVGANAAFVAGEAQYGIDQNTLAAHIRKLQATVAKAFPQIAFSEAKDRDTLQRLLGQDLPFVYLFCHGETVNVADRNTWLSFADSEKQRVTAKDFIGWTVIWGRQGKHIWDKVRPLVFMNACHSLEIAAKTLVSYLDAFAGNASAAGIIGTEVKVEQNLAMELGEQFFGAWLNGATVESALREVRMDFLRKGNLFGLVYTPYCWSELKVVKQA